MKISYHDELLSENGSCKSSFVIRDIFIAKLCFDLE